MSKKVINKELADINILEKFIIQINDEGHINQVSEFSIRRFDLKKELSKKNKERKKDTNKIEFISVNSNTSNFITEGEIFGILNVNKSGITQKTGSYQEKLYNHFITAKNEEDKGYLNDIIKKILDLKVEIEETKELMNNKTFMKEWKRNFGNLSPVKFLKNSGNYKTIKILKELI